MATQDKQHLDLLTLQAKEQWIKFAAATLSGCTVPYSGEGWPGPREAAEYAGRVADRMMAELAKRDQTRANNTGRQS